MHILIIVLKLLMSAFRKHIFTYLRIKCITSVLIFKELQGKKYIWKKMI